MAAKPENCELCEKGEPRRHEVCWPNLTNAPTSHHYYLQRWGSPGAARLARARRRMRKAARAGSNGAFAYTTTYTCTAPTVGLHNSPPLAKQTRVLGVELEGVVYLARQREELALVLRQRHAAPLRRDGGRVPVANLRTAANLSTFSCKCAQRAAAGCARGSARICTAACAARPCPSTRSYRLQQ